MRIYFFIFCLLGIQTQIILSQSNDKQGRKGNYSDDFPDFLKTLQLETKPDTTANASFGDFDGDGHLDILLVKGRHWPIVD
jgi:hypothetical protein